MSLNPTALVVAALALLPSAVRAEAVDFAQADVAEHTATAVAVAAVGSDDGDRPRSLLSATYARWSTGEAASVGYVWRRALAGDAHRWIVGAGIGANTFQSRASGDEHHDTAVSGRAQSEWYGPAPAGSYYALAQASTFRRSWLATGQYAPAPLPVAIEWTRYHERNYQATTLGLRIATGLPRWFVRIGSVRTNGESRPYIGVAYNAF